MNNYIDKISRGCLTCLILEKNCWKNTFWEILTTVDFQFVSINIFWNCEKNKYFMTSNIKNVTKNSILNLAISLRKFAISGHKNGLFENDILGILTTVDFQFVSINIFWNCEKNKYFMTSNMKKCYEKFNPKFGNFIKEVCHFRS